MCGYIPSLNIYWKGDQTVNEITFLPIYLKKPMDERSVRAKRDALWACALRLYKQDPNACGLPRELEAAARARSDEFIRSLSRKERNKRKRERRSRR